MAQKTNAELKVLAHKYEAKKHGAKSTLTAEEWEDILTAHEGRCAYCKINEATVLEHITPMSKGGENTAQNVVPACLSCNSKKGNRTPEEWKAGIKCVRPPRPRGYKMMTAKRRRLFIETGRFE